MPETVEETTLDEFTCDSCDLQVSAENESRVLGVCAACFDTNYYTCEDCSESEEADNCRFPGDRVVCESCYANYFECYSCGGMYDSECVSSYTPEDYPNRAYCEDCASRYLTFCENCDTHTRDGCNCREVGHVSDYTFDGLLDYSTKPDYDFLALPYERVDNGTIFMGIELEIELDGCDESATLNIIRKHLSGKAICKYDGSLNDGIEIVTCPMTLDYFKSLPWKELLDELRRAGCRSHTGGTCGLHVHTTRRNSATQYYKIDGRLNRYPHVNNMYSWVVKSLERKLKPFSRRKNFGYCQFTAEPDSRRTAANVTSDTVEYRFNRGTLNYTSFRASVELCHALASYSRWIGPTMVKRHCAIAYIIPSNKPFVYDKARELENCFLEFMKNSRVYGYAVKRWSDI